MQRTAISTRASSRTPTPKQLAERTFLLTSARGAPELTGAVASVSFRAADLTFHAGCNAHFGDYQIRDGAIAIASIGATEKSCRPDARAHAQEDYLADFLRAGPLVELEGATLTLSRGDVSLSFLDRVEADPDRELVGTAWKLKSYTAHGTSTWWKLEVEPSLVFAADRRFVAKSGCLTMEGKYTLRGQKLVLSSARKEPAPCRAEGDRAMASVMTRLLTNGATAYEVEAAHLTLRRSGFVIRAFAN